METLPIAFMNAAGWAKTVEQVEKLAKVPTISHVVIGSFTIEAREGNVGGTNFNVSVLDGTSVNSLGLPNGGAAYLDAYGKEMEQIAVENEKIFVVSIAGFSPSEYEQLATIAFENGAHIVEVNAGCPNVHDDGKQKEIVSYNLEMLESILSHIGYSTKGKPLWLKLSPYANPEDRVRVAKLVEQFEDIDAIVVANTFPNISMYHPDGKPFINVANNYGGMAGTALKWINLSQCRHYRELLPDFINIIGVGGISSGQDMYDYLRVGCRGVQVGTSFFWSENFRVFEKITTELLDVAEQYTTDA